MSEIKEIEYNEYTLGNFIDALESLNPKGAISYAFGWLVPTTFHSARGSYSEVALGWKVGDYREVKVADLLELAKAADGATYEGWKGGDYKMKRDTRMWIENYGDGGGTSVVGISGEYLDHDEPNYYIEVAKRDF
jgi:hypothetical protein